MTAKNSPKERRRALADELAKENLDIAIISNPKHIFYFSGFPSNLNMYLTLMKGPRSTSFLAIDRDSKAYFLLGKTELANLWAQKPGKSVLGKIFDGEVSTYVDYDPSKRMVTYGDLLSSEVGEWLKNMSAQRVGIEEWHLADIYRSTISNALNGAALVGISSTLLTMRKSKGRDEIANLKGATGMIDYAYRYAEINSKIGKTEVDVYREMNYETFKKYGPFGWIIGDHASGERSLDVGGWPTERKFRRGDTIILDLQASYNNYWSDLCRTFVIGSKQSKKQLHVLETLMRAKERAEELLRPGTKGSELYNACNEEITKAGYPKLPHHAGHSIGLDDQEPPWFLPESDDELVEGAVCVLEPGIYIKETGGIRIEDAYVITRKGHETISNYPLRL